MQVYCAAGCALATSLTNLSRRVARAGDAAHAGATVVNVSLKHVARLLKALLVSDSSLLLCESPCPRGVMRGDMRQCLARPGGVYATTTRMKR